MDHQHVVRGSEVFVGGLARNTTEIKIREVFSTCGEIVEVRLIKDQKGDIKGYCFVRFATKEAADKAVKQKSGISLEGKKIGVLPSNEQNSLYLGNLRKDWSADDFDKIVHQAFPDVVSIDLAMPFSSGDSALGQKQQNRGFAIVKFSSHAAAARAYRLGSSSDFILAANCRPAVEWAKDEPDVNPEELAKMKIAFVRNLPANANEDYLKKLFEPLGKLDRVVLSKKSRSPVGFVHFAERSDLDNAIKEMNGKTVQGPNGGPSIKLVVEVARPIEKNRKRTLDDPQSKPASKMSSHSKISKDEPTLTTYGGLKSGALEPKYTLEEPVVVDPYEAAVISLPVAVKERLLRILRLGIATRFDINVACLTSLRGLPESTSITILDQFMLSGAEKLNKGEYLCALISRYHDKLGVNQHALSLARVGDIATMESPLSSISSRVHHSAVDTIGSRAGTAISGYDIYTSRYSSPFSTYPLPFSRLSYGKMEESGQDPLLSSRVSYARMEESGRDPLSSRVSYARMEESGRDTLPSSRVSYARMDESVRDPLPSSRVIYAQMEESARDPLPSSRVSYAKMEEGGRDPRPSRASYAKIDESIPSTLHRTLGSSTSYSKIELESSLISPAAASDHQPKRNQVRFDPFTGEPYKFDPFTGEPIVPDSLPRRF